MIFSRTLSSLSLLFVLFQVQAEEQNASEPVGCKSDFTPAQSDHDFIGTGNELPRRNAKISKVHITRLPIFNEADPDENNWLFRAANRIHILTQDKTIQEQLLFTEGDTYDAREVEESARILRDQGYLYDAGIRMVKDCPGEVELEVVTRDVWSLNIETSFSRSGGENQFRIGIAEDNLLGTGQRIGLISRSDTNRRTKEISYSDRTFAGSRVRTLIRIGDSDDGSHQQFSAVLPFYALDTKTAWGVNLSNLEQIDKQYYRGEDLSEIRNESEDYRVFYGFSNGLEDGLAHRWLVGYRYFDLEFSPTFDLPAPSISPVSKELSYPFVQYEVIEDNYTTGFNFDQIHRTEDLHLGFRFRASFGYASTDIGSDQDRWVFSGDYFSTLAYTDNILLRHNLRWNGYYNADTEEPEDVVVSYDISYFRSQTTHRSFFARFNAVYTDNLNSHDQILLGGESGVRGFKNRLQTGDRKVLLTLEERQYTNYHLLNLAYLGFAVFLDVGRAWTPGIDEGFEDKYLANAGFGIRLASSKADAGRIIHIDFAFPLNNRDDPDVDSSQVTINIKNSL